MKHLFNGPGRSVSFVKCATLSREAICLLVLSLLITLFVSACEKEGPELRCIPNVPEFLEGEWEVTLGILGDDGVYTTNDTPETVAFGEDGERIAGSSFLFCIEPFAELTSSTYTGCNYIIESRRRVAFEEYERLPNKVYIIENYGADDYMIWRMTISLDRCYSGNNAAEFRRIE